MMDEEQVEAAVDWLKRAVDAKPTDLTALNKLGNALLMGGETQSALKVYQRAEKIDPNNVDTLNNIAQVMAASEETDIIAGELYRKSLALQPQRLPTRLNYASYLNSKGLREQALSLLRETQGNSKQEQDLVRFMTDALTDPNSAGALINRAKEHE